jgi:hypothetical protein
MTRRTRIEDLPAVEKELTTEEMKEVQGGAGGHPIGGSRPGQEFVTLKYPSDNDELMEPIK